MPFYPPPQPTLLMASIHLPPLRKLTRHLACLSLLSLCLSLLLSAPLQAAGIEKLVRPECKDQLCFIWWPALTIPPGWVHDRENSLDNRINLLLPKGSRFNNADAILYGKASYKPREPEIHSLAEFIARDKADFKKSFPGLQIADAPPIKTASGLTLTSVYYTPTLNNGSWERVAYGETEEYYLTFVISSHTPAGLKKAMPAYEKMLKSY